MGKTDLNGTNRSPNLICP